MHVEEWLSYFNTMRQLKFVQIIKIQQYIALQTVQNLDFSCHEHGHNKKRDMYQQMSYNYQHVWNIVEALRAISAHGESTSQVYV